VDAILAGTSGVGQITRFDAKDFSTTIAAEVKGFDPEGFIDRKEIKRMDPFIHYAMAAAHMAMEDAGLVIDAALAPKAASTWGAAGRALHLERYHQAYMEGGRGRSAPSSSRCSSRTSPPGTSRCDTAPRVRTSPRRPRARRPATRPARDARDPQRGLRRGDRGGAESTITPSVWAGSAR